MKVLVFPASNSRSDRAGFSLVEITLAMGIAAVAMVSILGMLPHALNYSRDGADQTAIGAVLEDVHDRLKGIVLRVGQVEDAPFFYDQQGRFWNEDRQEGDAFENARFFRVDVAIVEPASLPETDYPDSLHVAVVKLYWPLNESGEPFDAERPRTSVSYPVTTLTGPQWREIDSGYEPKLEY